MRSSYRFSGRSKTNSAPRHRDDRCICINRYHTGIEKYFMLMNGDYGRADYSRHQVTDGVSSLLLIMSQASVVRMRNNFLS